MFQTRGQKKIQLTIFFGVAFSKLSNITFSNIPCMVDNSFHEGGGKIH